MKANKKVKTISLILALCILISAIPISIIIFNHRGNDDEIPNDDNGNNDVLNNNGLQLKTDGLPTVPLTDAKIQDFLRYTPYESGDVIVTDGGYTTYNVAEIAIISGCSPEFMPVCVALSKALNDKEWVESLKSTHGVTPVAWFNGPIARQLGIDCGQGMISDLYSKVIARFINLALLNMTDIDTNDPSSAFGSIDTFVFAEDEQACLNVGWQPYHVAQGMDINESTITLSTTTSWGNNLTPATPEGEKVMELIAWDVTERESSALGAGDAQCYRTIFVTESVAANLAAVYKTKGELEAALIETALRPFWLRAYASYYANPNEKLSDKYTLEEYYDILMELESEDIERSNVPEWYDSLLSDTKKLLTTSTMNEGETRILVGGDSSRNKAQTMSGGKCTTIKIELPENWDNLLAAINQDPTTYFFYELISTFYLGTDVDTTQIPEVTPEFSDSTSTDSCDTDVYAVMSPVGYNTVEMIEQPPRLDTLDGKKIAMVGRSFNAEITQEVLKELILRDYPTATIYTLDDLGYGGSYSVFNPSAQSKEFQAKLIEYGIDAVIVGNCGCGLCTVKESGSAIAAEYIGIPAVAVGATSFVAEIHSTGTNRGVPVLRAVEYPGAFSADSVEVLKQKTVEYVYPELIKALTTPITQEEIDSLANADYRSYDDVIVSGSYNMIQKYFQMNGWSDGLPINMPTAEKVEEYLKYTPYDASTILGVYPVAYREARVYTVAVNAVMAGCPPEYMPLCIAFVECMDDPDWRKTLASTHGWSPYAWINGPVARQLGLDSGSGMMNAENNKKLARFIELAMLNIGGYYINENRMGTFGYLTPWVFSEDEEACTEIGWQPYHVTQGLNINDNAITAASALFWGTDLTPQTDDPEQIVNIIAFDVTEKGQNALGNTSPQVYRTMYITADVAKRLAEEYASKSDFENALINTARRPLWLRVYAAYWANPGSYQYNVRTIKQFYTMIVSDVTEDAKMTAVPDWYKALLPDTDEIMTISTMNKGDTPILITGNATANRVQLLPGGGYVTTKIHLPDNWDALMAELGYEPISSFYLEDENAVEGPFDVSEILNDGNYKIMPGAEQVTAKGRIFADKYSGNITYWSERLGKTCVVNDAVIARIIALLGASSSISVDDGIITTYTIRPSAITTITEKDMSILGADIFKGAEVVIAATTAKGNSGGATPNDSSVIISDTVNRVKIDLGGNVEILNSSTSDFLTLDGEYLLINGNAENGSTATIGVKLSDGKYAAFTFTKEVGTYKIIYNTVAE